MTEIYLVPREGNPRATVADIVQRLTSAGLPCREEPDEWGHWVVFDGRESTLNFSVDEGGAAVFVTLDLADDGAEFLSAVECVFLKEGWETGEDDLTSA